MVYGTDEIGVRGSTCESVTIVGAGAPGGVSGPWADALSIANKIAHRTHRLVTSRLLIVYLLRFLVYLLRFLVMVCAEALAVNNNFVAGLVGKTVKLGERLLVASA